MTTPITAADMHRVACCTGDCRQGRDCPVRADAIALNQTDGGMSVDTDKPLFEPWTLIWLLAEVLAGFVVAAFIGVLGTFAYTNWPLLKLAFGNS
jgi:hypothetical protein